MIPTILASALGLLFAAIAGFRRYERALSVSFLVLFLYLALRYDFGNDYRAYADAFLDINRASSIDYWGPDVSFEPGWVWMCRVFEPFGFHVLVAVSALFSCLVYRRFFLANVPPNYYWVAFFLYTVAPENMLTQLSAMRQAVAIGLVVLSVSYLIKRQFAGFAALVACATLFHFSAVVFLPLFFIGRDFSLNRVLVAIVFFVYVMLFFFAEAIVGGMVQSLSGLEGSSAIDRYVSYDDKGSFGSGVGVAYYAIYLLSLLWAHNSLDIRGKVIVRLALLGTCLVPLVLSMAMLGRIALYLNVFSIAAIPLVACCIKNASLRYAYLGVHCLFAARAFSAFFEDPVFKDAYSTYTTIFSTLY